MPAHETGRPTSRSDDPGAGWLRRCRSRSRHGFWRSCPDCGSDALAVDARLARAEPAERRDQPPLPVGLQRGQEAARLHRLGAGRLAPSRVSSVRAPIASTCVPRSRRVIDDASGDDDSAREICRIGCGSTGASELDRSEADSDAAAGRPARAPTLRAVPRAGRGGPHRSSRSELRQRLSWEAVMEYGLNARVGRTLESTLCSTRGRRSGRARAAPQRSWRWSCARTRSSSRCARRAVSTRTRLEHFLAGLLHRVRCAAASTTRCCEGYIREGGVPGSC